MTDSALLAEEQVVWRYGLRALLEFEPDMQVVDETQNGRHADGYRTPGPGPTC
jgi:DNA-binding NarL/FixJ family response regulator